MITDIIDLLRRYDHYGTNEHIEFAKGSHLYANTIKKGLKKAKRKWRGNRK